MMYKVRPGILYRTIADGHYLISSGEAARECPPIQQINDGAAYYWEMLEQGKAPEEILDITASESGTDKERLRPGFEQFLNELKKRKLIIGDEEPHEQRFGQHPD